MDNIQQDGILVGKLPEPDEGGMEDACRTLLAVERDLGGIERQIRQKELDIHQLQVEAAECRVDIAEMRHYLIIELRMRGRSREYLGEYQVVLTDSEELPQVPPC